MKTAQKLYVAIIIAGSTNGGKTSVSDRLLKEFPNSILVKQDDYFREPDDPNHIWITLSNQIRHQDWERYSSLDWAKLDETLLKLHQEAANDRENCVRNQTTNLNQTTELNNNEVRDLESVKNEFKLIMIEGHAVLCHSFPSFFKVDKKIFLTLGEEVCRARRSTRTYEPPDPKNYFEECVWPTYLEHLALAKANHPDAIFVNGELDKETVFQQVKKEIVDVYLRLL